MNKFYVYFHFRKSDNVLFYIGKGKNNRAWNRSKRNRYWYNTVRKHGYEVVIVDRELSESQAFELERFCISFFRDKAKLTNMTDGGEGFTGGVVSESTRKKISQKLKGKIVTSATRKKLSEAHKGRKLTPEHCLKLSKSKKGKYKGIDNPFADKNIYSFVRRSDGLIVTCTRQHLCSEYGLTSDQVKKLFAKSPRKTSKGWSLL